MVVRSTSRRVRLGILFLLVAVVVAAVAALPASAATPTTLTAKAQATTIVWGQKTVITGTLMTNEATPIALGGLWVDVYYAWSASGPWTLLAHVTTDSALYATGQYMVAVAPQRKTWYQFVFEGTAAYEAQSSNFIVINVKPALGKPTCPSSVKHGKKFTVWGTLKPQFTAGAQTVTVKAYKLNSHKKWVSYKTYKATNFDYKSYTKYKRSVTLSSKGKYRFKASTAATATLAAAVTGYSRTLTVN